MKKIRISGIALIEIIFHLLCLCITFVYSQTLNVFYSNLVFILYFIWMFFKFVKKRINPCDLLIILPIVMLSSNNRIILYGIIFLLFFLFKNPKLVIHSMLIKKNIFFLLMVFVGIVSTLLFAKDQQSGVTYIKYYLLLYFLIVSVDCVKKDNKCSPKNIITLFCWISLILGLGYFMTHSLGELFNSKHIEIYYISNYGVYSNTLAGILAPFLIGCVVVLFESNNFFHKFVSMIAIIPILLIILAIQSRGVYLGILLSLVWILIKKSKSKILIGTIFLSIIVLIAISFIPAEMLSRVFGRFDLSKYAEATNFLNGRFEAYSIAWNMFKNNLLIGCGFWQFNAYGGFFGDPHNFILTYLCSTGIIGCTCFIFYLINTYKEIQKKYIECIDNDSQIVIKLSMISFWIYLGHALVEPALTTIAPLSIFIVMTSISCKNKKEEIKND